MSCHYRILARIFWLNCAVRQQKLVHTLADINCGHIWGTLHTCMESDTFCTLSVLCFVVPKYTSLLIFALFNLRKNVIICYEIICHCLTVLSDLSSITATISVASVLLIK